MAKQLEIFVKENFDHKINLEEVSLVESQKILLNNFLCKRLVPKQRSNFGEVELA